MSMVPKGHFGGGRVDRHVDRSLGTGLGVANIGEGQEINSAWKAGRE